MRAILALLVVGATLSLRLPSPHPEVWFLVGYPDSPYHEQRSYWLRPVIWPPAEVVLDHPWALLDVKVLHECLDVGSVLACGALVYMVPSTVLLLPLWEGVGQFAPAPWAALAAVAAARYGSKVSPFLPLFRQEDLVISVVDALDRGNTWVIPVALLASAVTPAFNYLLLGNPWTTGRFMNTHPTPFPVPLRDIVCTTLTGVPILAALRRSSLPRPSRVIVTALVAAAVLPGSYLVSSPERYLLPVGAYLFARGWGPGENVALPVLACTLGTFLGFSLQPWTLHVESHLDGVHGATFQTFLGIPCLVGNFLAVESLKHGEVVWEPPFVPQWFQRECPKVEVLYVWEGHDYRVWYLSDRLNNLPKKTLIAWKLWDYSNDNVKYKVMIEFSYKRKTVILRGKHV